MPLIKLNKAEQKRLTLFFTCLAIATIAWLFFALANRYVYQVNTVVNFIEVPQNKAFHSLQSDTVKLQVEGTGWQLIFARLRIKPQSVNVSLKNLSTKNFVTFTDQLGPVNRQLESSQRVVSVLPDTLYFDFAKQAIKKVPIRVPYKLSFRGQYDIAGPINTIPQYVTVTGPVEELSKITRWETDTLRAINLSDALRARVPLKKSKMANISMYPAAAEVQVPVDNFTEKQLDVPVKVINNKRMLEVKLLPGQVRVTVLTSLRSFEQLNPDRFEATVDLEQWKKGYTQLPIKLSKLPPFVKVVRLEPQVV